MAISPDLIEAIKKQRAGIFVGAGASRDAGLPNWSGLLKELIESARNSPGAAKDLVSDCERILPDATKHLVLASILKDELAHNFPKFIESRFTADGLLPTDIDRALVDLPVQFFITTNYDRLVERAYSEKFSGKRDLNTFTYKQTGQAASCLFRGKQFILHAHGDAASEPEGVVLSEKDYRLLIHHSPGYQSLLQTLFTTFTVLFVGTSLQDVELRLLLGFIHSSFHGKTPTHFALMSDAEQNNAEIRAFFRDFNVEIISVRRDKITEDVIAFLKELSGKVA